MTQQINPNNQRAYLFIWMNTINYDPLSKMPYKTVKSSLLYCTSYKEKRQENDKNLTVFINFSRKIF